jgi:DNA polymerase-1
MIPAGLSSHNLLVVVDFSWWLNRAYRIVEIDGMASMVVKWFTDLLRGDAPAFLAAAVDSIGPTWRHELTEGLPEEQQYKGHRDPKPPEFYAVSRKILDIVKMHRIPIFYAEGYEADDCFAAAVYCARENGLVTVILSEDKDLGQLVFPDVFLWDGAGKLRGPAEIEANPKHPVPPRLIADLLAIVGDTGDNVRGVKGLGPVAAAAVLRRFGSLEAALASEPVGNGPVALAAIKSLEKEIARANGVGVDGRRAELARLRAERDVGKALAMIQAHRDEVLLAKRLVTLDADAPIRFDLRELAIGGYDVEAIRKAYRALGLKNIAEEVLYFPKDDPRAEGAA